MKRKAENKLNVVKFKKKKNDANKKVLTAEERERRRTSLYRAPTSEELEELRQNEHLYKNNLFKMQIQYLLEEVCIKEKTTQKINDRLHSLNSFLKNIASQTKTFQFTDNGFLPKDFPLPLPNHIPVSKIKGKFCFTAPQETKVIGSYLLKTMTKPKTSVNVMVEIPKEYLEARDYLNFRYHFKRATYLVWLASHLQTWQFTDSLRYSCTDDAYKPTLIVNIKGTKRFTITIHLCIPENIFKLSRFSPTKSNIRSNWYEDIDSETVEENVCSTPHYNASILSDILYELHLKLLYNATKVCSGMRDAICLFKVWLKQRLFGGVSAFNGFIGSMFMAYLLEKRKISSQLSSYQIFRVALHEIATSDWTTNGISFNEISVNDFHNQYEVVFIDSTNQFNLMANVNKITYEMMRYQAELALDILDSNLENTFEVLFIKSQNFLQFTDHTFRLFDLEDLREKLFSEEQYKYSVMNYGGEWIKLVPTLVHDLLLKGLGQRVHHVFVKPEVEKQWDVHSNLETTDAEIWFGVHLNTEFSDSILTMGPPADFPDAKDFRRFWGHKSELRRFPDGSINEAVLWRIANKEEAKMVCKQIIEYLLKLHFDVPPSCVKYHADDFNALLKRRLKSPAEKSVSTTGEEEATHFMKTFDKLRKDIRAIEALPLKINSMDGIDSVFRLTEVVTPMQYNEKRRSDEAFLIPKLGTKCPPWCPVYRVVLQFETSGSWPDDLNAIQHVKAAFHIKLAECVRTRMNLPAVATPAFVDVIKSGYIFRISVVHYREIVLHQDSTDTCAVKKIEHEAAALRLDKLIVKKPLHNSLIHGLSNQFSAYALTTRLTKRWISSQMLFDHLNEEILELVVASLFLRPEPFEAPNSHMCGFLRFLQFMATFDWSIDPLIVNLNKEMTKEDEDSIRESFTTNRTNLPAMFVATSYDHQGNTWSKHISKQVLRRVKLLAEAALQIIETSSRESGCLVIEPLFRPPLSDYHVIISLKKEFVPLRFMSFHTANSTAPKLKDTVNNSCLPVADFNPVQLYLDELKSAFSNIALFFYDHYGGERIGVIWKPCAFSEQPFKILQARYKHIVKRKILKKKQKVSSVTELYKPNIKAILQDFQIIGRDLVKEVTNLRED